MARNSLADNNPDGARRLGALTRRQRTVRGSLSVTSEALDLDDFYSFRLRGRSSVNISLTGLQFDTSLRILRGTRVIATSNRRGKRGERIRRNLDAGTYFIKVSQEDRNTRYTLRAVSGAPIIPPDPDDPDGPVTPPPVFDTPNLITPPDPGEFLSTAFNDTRQLSVKSFRNTIGGTDTADVYRFTVNRSSIVKISTGNVEGGTVATSLIYDINGNARVDENDTFATGNVINKALGAGTYFVSITPASGENVTYNFKIEQTDVPNVNATPEPPIGLGGARDLGALNGELNIEQIVSTSDTSNPSLVGTFESTDIYRFTLGNEVNNFSALVNATQATGNFTVSLIYENGNISQLDPTQVQSVIEIDDRNGVANPGFEQDGVIGGDFIAGGFTGSSTDGAAITLNKTLGRGTYYLAVTQREITDNTTYDLNLFANSPESGILAGISPIVEGITPSNTIDPARNSLRSGLNLGELTEQNVSFKQFVGSTDNSDFYTFTLSSARNVIIRYSGNSELVALRFGSDYNGDGILGAGGYETGGDDLNGDGILAGTPELNDNINGVGRFEREVFPQQLYGDVVYSPLPPFFNEEAEFDTTRNAFLTTVPTDISAKLPPGTYSIQIDPQAIETDLGDGLTRYGSANVLYNLAFILEPPVTL